jgi:hypothetical protein
MVVIQDYKDEESLEFLREEIPNRLFNCKKLTDVNPNDYDVVFYVGGRNSISDLANACIN